MSRSAEERQGGGNDEGFSLIEIIVALGIFSVVLVALLPQLIVGIQATGTARIVTQAKGISQGQLERMRHLPFHIAPAAGDFVDVLDYYYPDVHAPTTTPTCKAGDDYELPTVGWSGYVDCRQRPHAVTTSRPPERSSARSRSSPPRQASAASRSWSTPSSCRGRRLPCR